MRNIKEIWSYRNMIISLVRKDLRGRYRGSVLGFLWTFINPLMQLVVYNIVFSTILHSDIEKFYLYMFIGLIPWIFFSSCLSNGSMAILGEKGLVTKIYFPREVLPISYVTSCFINMIYSFIVVLLIVIFSKVPINLTAWLFLPLIMIIEYAMGLGIAMITSGITVYFRDLQHILGIVAFSWQFLTPIVYSLDSVPEKYLRFFKLNPMTPIIIAYRDVLYYGEFPDGKTLLQASFFGVLVLIVGFAVFSKLKKGFAEEL